MSLDKAQELALQPLGRLVSYVTVGVAPPN